MLKILIFVAAGFLLYKLVTGSKRQKAVQKEKAEETLAASGEMIKDPVCGTYVPKDADIRVRDGGYGALFLQLRLPGQVPETNQGG